MSEIPEKCPFCDRLIRNYGTFPHFFENTGKCLGCNKLIRKEIESKILFCGICGSNLTKAMLYFPYNNTYHDGYYCKTVTCGVKIFTKEKKEKERIKKLSKY